MDFIASPHTHPESPLTGSTVESMVNRAVELGRKYFSYTDPGYMTSLYRGYEAATKKGLKYIPGVEVFFKDVDCSIIKGTNADKASYFKITLYATDQDKFQKLSILSSKKRDRNCTFYGSEYPLWDWSDLKEAADLGLIAVSSDHHDMISKHVVTNTLKLSEQILLKIKGLFGDNYYISIIGSEVSKAWVSLVKFKLYNDQEEVLYSTDIVHTNASKTARAKELVDNPNKHYMINGYKKNFITTNYKVPLRVKTAESHSGFLPFPDGDIQLKANKLLFALAKRHDVKVLYSDHAYYSNPEDKTVQDVRLSQDDIKEHSKRHMQTKEEARTYLLGMGLSENDIEKIDINIKEWASRFDSFNLKYEYRLPEIPDGKTGLQLCMEIILRTGRLDINNKIYTDRLKYEIDVLVNNGVVDFSKYFFPIHGVFKKYEDSDTITGPGRGSAAGSLFAYLMGITHVDPLKHDLSFERFYSLDRALNGDMPDIDSDLPDRTLLVGEDGKSGYLYSKYGDRAAQISTRSMLRLKSSIKDVNKFLHGEVEAEIEKLTKALPAAPQGVSDKDFVFGFEDSDGNRNAGLIEINNDLKKYAEQRPKEWEIVQKCLGVSRQVGKHASAFVIADAPIQSITPVFMDNITQYEAKAIEKSKLIKYDFLVVKQLMDIQKCIEFINKKNKEKLKAGHFTHNGKNTFIWDLPEDLDVYRSIWDGNTETIFQIHTQSMVPYVKRIRPKNMEDLSAILALVRPGTLDYIDPDTKLNMTDEYIERREGRGTYKVTELNSILPETFGVMVYQEQVSKISRQLGKMKPTDAEDLRKAFSKKNKRKAMEMKPIFMEGAAKEVGQEKAEIIWAQMETSSRYNFNKSHAISYSYTTYACMFLRHYYPLEWWASVLSNADESEISSSLFKYVRELVVAPDINLSTNEMVVDYNTGKIRSKLGVLRGLGETVAEPIVKNAPYKDIEDFISKKVAGPSLTKKLIHVGVMDSLFPKHFTLIDKMQAYEDAVNIAKYNEKIANGIKAKTPAKGSVDQEYLDMHPLKDYQTKKKILPTLPIDLSRLVKLYSPMFNEGTEDRPMYSNGKNKPSPLLTGDELTKVEQNLPMDRSFYFCAAGYIVDMKEFSFSKNEKKALKLSVDIDGRISERVLWPPWEQSSPVYPEDLKKGSIALFFMGIKEGRSESKIFEIKTILS